MPPRRSERIQNNAQILTFPAISDGERSDPSQDQDLPPDPVVERLSHSPLNEAHNPSNVLKRRGSVIATTTAKKYKTQEVRNTFTPQALMKLKTNQEKRKKQAFYDKKARRKQSEAEKALEDKEALEDEEALEDKEELEDGLYHLIAELIPREEWSSYRTTKRLQVLLE